MWNDWGVTINGRIWARPIVHAALHVRTTAHGFGTPTDLDSVASLRCIPDRWLEVTKGESKAIWRASRASDHF